ncbi:hypothetical protein NP233_g5065 [Leucocoprinus birnbaumii]|uniref:DUF6534 domain-containing protein n=1 Tax=Leucocoprinus birnbaumii TaxID=56174 RepID=A0AAD5VTL3_9AGAR|nr:hypothetical protein NP233_g5065 [Leucocoprinus birnbaumii]
MHGKPAEGIYGPVLIGLLFNVLVYGIIIGQCYAYFTTYKKDPLWTKMLVSTLVVVDIAMTVVIAHFLYDGVILHFGDFEYLTVADWHVMASPIMTGFVSIIVQLFYVSRIHALIKKRYFTVIMILLSFGSVVGACLTTWKVSRSLIYAQFQSWDRAYKVGFKQSDIVIDRIIRVAVQTGLLTSMAAIANMVSFLADSTGTHFIFNLPLSNLYTTSLLTSLNSREGWKFNQNNPSHLDPPQGNSVLGSHGVMSIISSKAPVIYCRDKQPVQSPEIFVHVESHEMRDVVLPAEKSDDRNDLEGLSDSASASDLKALVTGPGGRWNIGSSNAKDGVENWLSCVGENLSVQWVQRVERIQAYVDASFLKRP